MSPPYLFQLESSGRNWKEEEESEMGEVEPTILEREVADIIIYLLHRQDSISDRRSSQTIGLDFGFPRWTGKRKRSIHASAIVPVSYAGEPISVSSSNAPISFSPCKENDEDLASPVKARKVEVESRESCPKLMQGCFKSVVISEGELLFWTPEWRGIGGVREFVVPDLNVSAEDLASAAAAADDMRRRQEEVYGTACRRLAAANARRKRKELQRLKNSIAADAPLCSRVR